MQYVKINKSAQLFTFLNQVTGGYLNSRQHDSDHVVVREQQGTNNTAVTHMLDDG